MKWYGSRTGVVLACLYLLPAVWVAWDAFRHTGGGWINLRGLGVTLITAPSQLTFGLLFESISLPAVNYAAPGAAGYLQVGFHVAVSAAFIYLAGYCVERLVKRLRTHAQHAT